jgi:dTDP-4-amino-4,6-dideoxygalactose transaminase
MFQNIFEFENKIAEFFGSPYAVATDCCTHAIELCLRYKKYNNVSIPEHTYISIPFTAMKLNLRWTWKNENWKDYYYLGNTNIIDAAVLWQKNSYIPNTFMCLSFQYKKHLSLGRGGVILLQNKEDYDILKKMSYDGRSRDFPWTKQNIDTIGYHYYMTPETAILGMAKLPLAIQSNPKLWSYDDYPYLPAMKIFNDEKIPI